MHGSPHPVRRSTSRSVLALALVLCLAVPAALSGPSAAEAVGGQGLTAGTAIFSDAFTRSTIGGWGSAPGASAYGYDLASVFRTNGAQGVIDLPRPGIALTATLPISTPADSETTVRVMIPRVPAAGGGVYAGLQQRATGASYYQTSVRVDPVGDARLSVVRVNGSSATQVAIVGEVVIVRGIIPGKVVNIQSRVSGSATVAVDARAWVSGQAVPAWQAAAVDTSSARLVSGSTTRIWSYLSSTSKAQSLAFDDPTVRPLGAAPTPTPTPTPSVPGSSDPEQTVSRGDARPGSGSAAVGSTAYAVPADAVFVSPAGSDIGTGSKSAPYATIQKAVTVAPTGRTIVARAGTYHESVTLPAGKALTLQSYPGEAVWLDGSRELGSLTGSGSTRYASGWDITLDASPTYTRGAPDNTAVGWSFVNPAFPMAAHPDQVWIGTAAQKQVGSLAQVTTGTFFVDTAADRLYLGSAPAGAPVRSSDLVRALSIRGDGSVVRGIGVRRYAPSVADLGAVTVSGKGVTVQDVAITDNATTGISVIASGVTLTRITAARNGMLGMHANYADGLRASRLLVADNNTEGFNRAPVSGGFKITRSRDVDVVDSAFVRNAGNGLWFDESVYDVLVAGDDVLDGAGHGMVLELSSNILVVDNVVARNRLDGILVGDSGHIDIWNNTLALNERDVNIGQGSRRAADLSVAGHDPRQELPDPTVTWVVEDITVSNNVMQGGTGNALLAVEDHSHERSAADRAMRAAGNVYQRDDVTRPKWAIVWARGPGDPAVYNAVGVFAKATGNDTSSLDIAGRPVLGSRFRILPEIVEQQAAVAMAVPADVAALLGVPTGSRVLGALAG